jgi:hypothetical protein
LASTLMANISLLSCTPNANAVVYSYGIPQDEAARTGVGSPDLAQTNLAGAGTNFSFVFPAYSATVVSFLPAKPTLLTVTPSTGLTAGGTRVTITGSGFESGATITFGTNTAHSVDFISSTIHAPEQDHFAREAPLRSRARPWRRASSVGLRSSVVLGLVSAIAGRSAGFNSGT